MRFVEIAAVASVAWAIAGANAGMHLAVAPAVSAYRVCVDRPRRGQRQMPRRCFIAICEVYAGDRLSHALLVGLAPIPFGWLAGWLYVRQSRQARPRSRSPGSPWRTTLPATPSS